MILTRRSLFRGLGAGIALIAAPSIVRAANLMPIKPLRGEWITVAASSTIVSLPRAEWNREFTITNNGTVPLTVMAHPHEIILPPGGKQTWKPSAAYAVGQTVWLA